MTHLGDKAVRRAILDRIARVKPDSKGLWGKMTAHQMLCHLSDGYRFSLGEKPASMASGLFQRTIMKWGALYAPIQWPQGVPTRPEMEQGLGGTPPITFEKDRADLVANLERFSRGASKYPLHPIFGELTQNEWLRWGYLHADHHLRQFGI